MRCIVATGEENEKTVHSVRAKLFSMAKDAGQGQTWKERGTGMLRLNVAKRGFVSEASKSGPRLGEWLYASSLLLKYRG